MILAVAPFETNRSSGLQERSTHERNTLERTRPTNRFSRSAAKSSGAPKDPSPLRLRRPRHEALDQHPGCTGIEEAVEQLVQMNLVSLRGYQEVADVTNDPALRDFAQVMLRQRSAQCRELTEGWSGLLLAPALEDPAADELSVLWVRTLWNLDQDDSASGLEYIEEAEQVLEDAYLKAAALYEACSIAELFRRHATNVCGARQRLEEGLELDAVGSFVE